MYTICARTANDVSLIVAFWTHICKGITISLVCFSELITTKCESRTSTAEDVGEIFAARLLGVPQLPVREIVNEPVRFPSDVGVELSVRDFSFQISGFTCNRQPFESKKPIFNIEPFNRKMVAVVVKDGQKETVKTKQNKNTTKWWELVWAENWLQSIDDRTYGWVKPAPFANTALDCPYCLALSNRLWSLNRNWCQPTVLDWGWYLWKQKHNDDKLVYIQNIWQQTTTRNQTQKKTRI